MLMSSINGGPSQAVYSSGPQLVGNRYAPQIASTPMPTAVAAAQPRVSLVGATSHRARYTSVMTSRSPVDAYGRLLGTSDPLARAHATLVGIGAMRNSDIVGQSVDPTRMAPGQYQQAIRGGMYTSMRPSWWQPWAVYATGNIAPMGIRTHNPVEMARHSVDPYMASVRPLAPGVQGGPGTNGWPVYRSYQPITAFCQPGAADNSPYCGRTYTQPSPTSAYSPMVAAERVGTVRAAQRSGW